MLAASQQEASMRRWIALIVMAAAGATGATAAAEPAAGTVVQVSQEARVCVAGEAPPAGTLIRLTRRVCGQLDAKRVVPRCRDTAVAEGTVVRKESRGCAIVELPVGVTAQAGDTCEAATLASR
jgi:hypothetical protein